jgi:regulatory protein
VDDQKPDTPAELKARALRYLVRREHSRAELARKLAPRAESPEALAALLDHLVSRKQLSDERFAAERARSLSRKYGPAKIREDLKARGIVQDLIEHLSVGAEAERAKAILTRKYREPAASREERAKRARFLQGRGFSYDAIKKALALSDSD